MTNPGDGAQSPRRFGLLAGSTVAARAAIMLAAAGGISWLGFAIRALDKVRPDTNRFDYYPSSGWWSTRRRAPGNGGPSVWVG